MAESPARAVVLDRDGTIIVDENYLNDPSRVKWIEGAPEALRLLKQKGYLIFILSNQSGLGRGLISRNQFEAVQRKLEEFIAIEKVQVDAFLYCFHTPEDACGCRKPKAGLVPHQFQGKTIDWTRSFTVGDKDTDVLLANELGAQGCLVLTGKGQRTQEEWSDAPSGLPIFPSVREFAEFVPFS